MHVVAVYISHVTYIIYEHTLDKLSYCQITLSQEIL